MTEVIVEQPRQHQVCEKHPKNCKRLPRENIISCQGVKMFLLKDPFKVVFFLNLDLSYSKFCHNLSF